MTKAKKSSKEWSKTTIPNLVRYRTGVYYIRARHGQKEASRKSLKTKDFRLAKSRAAVELAKLRQSAPVRAGALPLTLWDALKIVRTQVETNPALKRRSVRAYLDVFKALEPDMRPIEKRKKEKKGVIPLTPLVDLTGPQMEDWWRETAQNFAPATANFHLLLVRRALVAARDAGALMGNPAVGLRRLHVPATKLKLITAEEFAKLVEAIRANDDPEAKNAADWVEFACYTGCRPEEANAVRWEHITPQWLTIHGGEEGTKNRQTRRVPVMAPLAALLERIPRRPDGLVLTPERTQASYGKILARISQAIGLPKLRRYDMRHLFATRCNEAGVDVPTFARWLGHKDGGALAMRVYVHPHADHETKAAAKVKF